MAVGVLERVGAMIVAATPEEGSLCWAFHFINDSDAPVQAVLLESVDYEWGDMGNSEAKGVRFGPIPPGGAVELMRETDTEVRTSVTLEVDGKRCVAEFGKLYRPGGPYPVIPVLNRPARRATIEFW
jgi:hypothetical protein